VLFKNYGPISKKEDRRSEAFSETGNKTIELFKNFDK